MLKYCHDHKMIFNLYITGANVAYAEDESTADVSMHHEDVSRKERILS